MIFVQDVCHALPVDELLICKICAHHVLKGCVLLLGPELANLAAFEQRVPSGPDLADLATEEACDLFPAILL